MAMIRLGIAALGTILLSALKFALALPPQSTHGVLDAAPVPTGQQVQVDGVLGDEEWSRAGRMLVYNARQLRQRYAVEVFSMWDAEAFYLGLHFLDPTPLINNVDAENAPFDGWQSDGFQGRFTTDYGQLHFDAWYSSRRDMAVGVLSYDAPVNTQNHRLFRARGKSVRDASGFALAFHEDSDRRGYVQEIRLPWRLLYRQVPSIKAGHTFRFTGEYYWGGPTGIKWPKVLWSDPINPENPVRIVVYQSPGIWGTCRLVGDAKEARGDPADESDEEARLQGSIPLRVEVPADAVRFSLAIDDAAGRRVRNLASHARVADYAGRSEAGQRMLEVPWDGRAEGGWDKERQLFLGDYVAPGRYTARVLVHGGVGVVHAGSFYNPGTPPWPTADGTGSWLSDHAPPHAVAAMSPVATTHGRVLLMARIAESGVMFLGLDREGRKIWEWVRNTAEMYEIAGSDRYGYFAFSYAGQPLLARLDPDNGRQVAFADGRQEVPLPGPVGGLAVGQGCVAVALRDSDQVLLLDAESAAQTGSLTIAKATQLAFAPDGRLLGLSNGELFLADPRDGRVTRFVLAAVKHPHAATCDRQGRLYVCDADTSTVVVLERIDPNARLLGTVGRGGGRPAGTFDPLQMAAPRSLAVDERSDGTRQLWCVEDIDHPRRVAVWDVANPGQAKLVRDYIGGTGYQGTGGLLSDEAPDLGIVNGVEFQIDYAQRQYRPLRVMGGRPDPQPGKTALFHVGAFPGMFGGGYHFTSDVSGRKVEYYVEGHGVCMVFMRRGDRWHCVAALGHQSHNVPFPEGFPQPDPAAGKVVFGWNDTNGDGYQQPDELQWCDVGQPQALYQGKLWGYRCDRRLAWYHSGLAFQPARFTAEGAPVYDLSRVERLPGELGQRGHVGDIYKTRFGYVLLAAKPNYTDPHGTIHGLVQLEGYDAAGTLRWTYPAYWLAVHGAFTAPMAMPGVIMGALKISGLVQMDGYDVIALRGNIGQEFLIRDDGLYVGELFTDQRMAPDELPPDGNIVGVPINETSLGGEPFSGWMARQDDGRVRLTYGQNDVRIAEVTGLETVRTVPPVTVDVAARDLELARAFVPRAAAGSQVTQANIPPGSALDLNQRPFGDDALVLRSGREEVGRAWLQFDDRNLYVAWQVDDLTPLVNTGTVPELAFKSGDAVGVLLAADGQHDPNQAGGVRVLVTLLGDQPTAVVYRPHGPGDQPFVFESPVRKSSFQYVAKEPSITVQARRQEQSYEVVASIPWSVIGVTPRDGSTLRGDVEALFGRQAGGGVERIVRWVDRQTNVVNDTPTEAEFFPGRWGTLKLGGTRIMEPRADDSAAQPSQRDTSDARNVDETRESEARPAGRWQTVYSESFDTLPTGLKTGEGPLAGWEAGSAAGVVRDGGPGSTSGKYLAAGCAWKHFNFGPVFTVDLGKFPHTRVRVSFNLYTFGPWRGNQAAGPTHRLGFWDSGATHAYSKYATFSTVAEQQQSWPDGEHDAQHPAGTGGQADADIDKADTHTHDYRWPVQFEYVSGSDRLRFCILSGAHDLGSGPRIPEPYFGVDDVKVEVLDESQRSAATDTSAPPSQAPPFRWTDPPPAASPPFAFRFHVDEPGFLTLVIENDQGVRVCNLVGETAFEPGDHSVSWDGRDETPKNFRICGLYDLDPQPVPAGGYRIRGLFRKAIDLRYELTANNAGQPPWPKQDGTGRWLADHSPPSDVLFLPPGRTPHRGSVRDASWQASDQLFIPTDEPLVLVCSHVAESGDGLVWVDLEGRKRRGVRSLGVGGGWCGAQRLARDEGPRADTASYAYHGTGWKNWIDVRTLPANERVYYEEFPQGEMVLSGLAVRNGLLVASAGPLEQLVVVDVPTRKKLGTIQLPRPGGVHFDRQGRLLAVSGQQLVRIDLRPLTERTADSAAAERNLIGNPPVPEVVVAEGLAAPQQTTVDQEDRIYVSDWGPAHQVRVFTPDGSPVRQIGIAGAPQLGRYEPRRMQNPSGMTIDAQDHLWVAEADYSPKRISVWTLDGRLVQAFYGPPGYGGGGTLDPRDKTRLYLGYGSGLEFQLDWCEQGPGIDCPERSPSGLRTGLPIHRYWLPDVQALTLGGVWHAAPETPIYVDGRQYMTNDFTGNPGGFNDVCGIWLMRDARAIPVAAAGAVANWPPLKDAAFTARWPAGADPANVFFVWSDLNHDGRPQPEEITVAQDDGIQHANRKSVGGVYLGPDLSLTTAFGLHVRPSGFTPQGVPIYDAVGAQRLVSKMEFQWVPYDAVYSRDGWFIVKAEPMRGFRNGRLVWTYPNRWPELHATLNEPPPLPQAGQLIGSMRWLGHPVTPRGSDVGELWAIGGYYGRVHLITSDGLFVASLFQDARKTGYFNAFESLGDAQPGLLINNASLQTESFFDTITQTSDGCVYLRAGKSQGNIIRVDGLESIRRLPDLPFRLQR